MLDPIDKLIRESFNFKLIRRSWFYLVLVLGTAEYCQINYLLQSLELKDSIHSIYDLKEKVFNFLSNSTLMYLSNIHQSLDYRFLRKARSPYYVPDLPSLHSELPGSPSLIQPILEEDNRPPAWRLDRRSTLTSSIDVNTSCTDGHDICLDVS